jgi:tight adherence protein C
MTPTLIALVVVGIAAIAVAAVSLLSILQRREVLQRATEEGVAIAPTLLRPEKSAESRVQEYLTRLAGAREEQPELKAKLIQAGIETPTAALMYSLLRTVSLVAFPLIVWLLAPKTNSLVFGIALSTALFFGYILPLATLDRLVRLRQERVRRSVPDALDLLVVCVEAGISLDAAILRVARDIRLLHPDLATELAVVNRVTNAGIPRDQALRGLWERTGVQELRTLVSSLVQSEKWGTSIATVLRVASDTLRRKRRQAAEKQAKQAALKMTFPLLLLILPPLFAVILGPAIMQLVREFGRI